MNVPENKNRLISRFSEINLKILEEKDYLTEVSLRSAFKPFLEGLIKESESQKKTFSIVFMDLDHFKKINDKYGHLFGDEVLKYIGSSLRLSFEGIPCQIFRYGGDEFLLVLPDKTGQEAKKMVQLLKYNMMHRPILFKNKFFKITSSYGIASYPVDGTTVEDLIRKSDTALYFSKHQGRNYITLFNEIIRRRIIRHLIQALKLLLCAWLVWATRAEIAVSFKLTGTIISQMIDKTQEKNRDKVVLKNGSVVQGTIINETHKALTISYRTKDGPAAMFILKSEISSKTYGLKTSSRKRFEEYTRQSPNPHDE
ncbi:MAG: GGDEF domain-containing protein [Geobacteraceae bacterium]|nr:GGDEF domain-containing protein [Geobacteraceae bacterium]